MAKTSRAAAHADVVEDSPALSIDEKQARIDQLKAEIADLERPEPIAFPKWIYYADGHACIVQTPAELAKAEPGWADTPAIYAQKAEK